MSGIKDELDIMNEILSSKFPSGEVYFSYLEANYYEEIKLHILLNDNDIEIHIWDSENEVREFFEGSNEYESFVRFMKRKLDETLDSIKSIKSAIYE